MSHFDASINPLRERMMEFARQDWTKYTLRHVYAEMEKAKWRVTILLGEMERFTDLKHQQLMIFVKWEETNHMKLGCHMFQLKDQVLRRQGIDQQHLQWTPLLIQYLAQLDNTTFEQLDTMVYNLLEDQGQKLEHTQAKNGLQLYRYADIQEAHNKLAMQAHTPVMPTHSSQTQQAQNSPAVQAHHSIRQPGRLQTQQAQNNPAMQAHPFTRQPQMSQIQQPANSLPMQAHTSVRPAEKRKHIENDEGAEEQPSSKRPKTQPISKRNSPVANTQAANLHPRVAAPIQVDTGLLTPESMSTPGEDVDYYLNDVLPQSEHQLQPAKRIEAEQLEAERVRQARQAWKDEEARRERNRQKNIAADKAWSIRQGVMQAEKELLIQKAETERRARLKREEEAAELERKEALEAATREKAKRDAEQAELEAARSKAEEDKPIRLAKEQAAPPRLCENCQEHAEKLREDIEELASLQALHAKLANPLLKGRVQKQIEVHEQDMKRLVEDSNFKVQVDWHIEPYWQCEHFMEVEEDDNYDDDNDCDNGNSQLDNKSDANDNPENKVEQNEHNNVGGEGLEVEEGSDVGAEFQAFLDKSDDEDDALFGGESDGESIDSDDSANWSEVE